MIKSYQHAQKLYQIADRSMGVMTYGVGNIGPRSIGSFITEFSRTVEANLTLTTVQDITARLSAFLQAAHAGAFGTVAPEKRPDLGILVGGYSQGQPLAEEWEFIVPSKPEPRLVRPANSFGASWRGVSVPFTRLYKGVDPRLPDELLKVGVKQEQINAVREKFTSPFIFDGMPIQEAIEFVTFILDTTINTAKFEAGAASCGGPIWVAVATPGGFDWVKKHEWRARPY